MTMRPLLRAAFEHELREALEAEARAEPPRAWRHLERAHVLSQGFAGPHVRVHWRMLGYGWRRRDVKEVWGQLLRVLGAGPASWLGRAPVGNTGGADVGIFTPMPIPDDLRTILDAEG
ncbi:DUF3703 domain-containing protein [Myxococcus stipitatus]|uniref:DUF3703 domain-containing protein n=1 Tax=Myxococcus stipitatus TaxID=83455 RepID=UPI0031450E34